MRRLFDVSVSILMAAVLLMCQSWAVTAAYADYSVNGSTDSTNLNSEDSNAIDDGSGPEGQESNASPVVNESQDTQQGSSEDRSEVVADDSRKQSADRQKRKCFCPCAEYRLDGSGWFG